MTRLAHAIRRGILMLAAGLLTSSGSIAQVSPDTQPSRPNGRSLDAIDVNAWLDGYLPFALRSGDIPGAVVVVVKDGGVLVARGYGLADIVSHRPVDPDRTLFRVGSVSKLFTWTAVMQQVEAGKLDLDRDVNAYLDFRIPPYRGRPITLRQIMTHTSGFELAGKDTITFGPPIALDAYLKRWVPNRIYAPGTTPAYSNWATALAGYIVQRASGTPYDDYVERRIFAPLGMRYATFRQPLPAGFASLMAKGYPRASAPSQPFEVIGPSPAGALSASGTDMARFMIAHLKGGSGLMSPQTAASMHDGSLGSIDPASLVPPLNRAALGFLESNINGHRVIGHLGDTQNFHTLLQLFPKDGVGLFLSFNSSGRDGAATSVRNQLFEDFADRYFPATPVTSRVDADTARAHAQLMAGMWEDSRHAENSFLALTRLAQTTVKVTGDGELTIPSLKDAAGVPQRWVEIAPFVWLSRSGHERLAAKLVDGQVVRWSTDSLAPTAVFGRVPAMRSAAWLLPALLASVATLLLTALYWPAAWLVGRRYRAKIALTGKALHAYRALRVASLLDLVVLGGWVVLLAAMFSNISLIGARSDGWLRLLQISGAIVFVGAVIVAAWNATMTWRDGRAWTRKLWSAVVVLATLTILYVAWSFGLLAQTVDY